MLGGPLALAGCEGLSEHKGPPGLFDDLEANEDYEDRIKLDLLEAIDKGTVSDTLVGCCEVPMAPLIGTGDPMISPADRVFSRELPVLDRRGRAVTGRVIMGWLKIDSVPESYGGGHEDVVVVEVRSVVMLVVGMIGESMQRVT